MSSGVDSGAPPSYEEASSGVDLPEYEEVSSGEPLPEYEEGYPIDIVAIHGLTGDNRTTWEANDVYWLRDFLPSDLPGVRVFSFGYKAGVSNSTGTAGLDSWAQELLNYVKMTLRRPQAKNPYRPIFLVCHGMGGILAKKALVVACHDKDKFGDISDAICGFLFFATPHRGLSKSNMIGLAGIIKAGPGKEFFCHSSSAFRSDLLKGLEANSEELTQLIIDVKDLLKGKKIVAFQEGQKSRVSRTTTVVVEPWSAQLSIPGERLRPMTDDDHVSICRFGTRGCRYRTALNAVQDCVEDAITNL